MEPVVSSTLPIEWVVVPVAQVHLPDRGGRLARALQVAPHDRGLVVLPACQEHMILVLEDGGAQPGWRSWWHQIRMEHPSAVRIDGRNRARTDATRGTPEHCHCSCGVDGDHAAVGAERIGRTVQLATPTGLPPRVMTESHAEACGAAGSSGGERSGPLWGD